MILVSPFSSFQDLVLRAPDCDVSKECCGKYVSVSDSVVQPSEVAGENFVSVTKQAGLVLELRVNEFGRYDVHRVVFR